MQTQVHVLKCTVIVQNLGTLNSKRSEVQGTDVSSSGETGTQKSTTGAEWKSTADSAPNPAHASLSKESIVPQRSQAVHDQPTSDEGGSPHSKGEPWCLIALPSAAQSCSWKFSGMSKGT